MICSLPKPGGDLSWIQLPVSSSSPLALDFDVVHYDLTTWILKHGPIVDRRKHFECHIITCKLLHQSESHSLANHGYFSRQLPLEPTRLFRNFCMGRTLRESSVGLCQTIRSETRPFMFPPSLPNNQSGHVLIGPDGKLDSMYIKHIR